MDDALEVDEEEDEVEVVTFDVVVDDGNVTMTTTWVVDEVDVVVGTVPPQPMNKTENSIKTTKRQEFLAI